MFRSDCPMRNKVGRGFSGVENEEYIVGAQPAKAARERSERLRAFAGRGCGPHDSKESLYYYWYDSKNLSSKFTR